MSEQAYVVIPVGADGKQPAEQDKAKIASALQESLNKQTHPAQHEKHHGPLKEILAHQDSLYKYISWEDPIRTVCSYICVMSILLGAHYLPLTQLALKAGAFTLGLISVTEFVCRLFGPDNFIARLRPKEYKKVPESTLNDSLKDIHDFVQYSVVQAQRVLYGQNLDKTFAAFLGLTAMYWLVKAASPFAISVLGVTSFYIIPLIISPPGREVAHDARLLAGELANTAVDNGKALDHGASAKAVGQSEKLREISMDTGRHVGNAAHSGMQAVVDLSTWTKDAALGSTEATNGNTTGLVERDRNADNKSPSAMHSGLVDRKPVSHNSFPSARKHTVDYNEAVDGKMVNEP